MEALIIMGIVYWVVQTRRNKNTVQPARRVLPRNIPNRNIPAAEPPIRTASYVDDGILSAEEAAAIMQLLRLYNSADTLQQQEMQHRMDARILAQFNHLLNSTWSIEGTSIEEYLAQQGRHGRYTALGVYALRVVR